MSATWEPNRNAVHGLIQLIDVLAIALDQFRQLSFKLPHYNDERYQAERQRLRDAYFAIKNAVFPSADIAPQHTAARIAYRAVAELARSGSQDEVAVGNAQQWMTAMGWVLVPHEAPKDVGSEFWRPFDNEGEILSQYTAVRQRLLAALARIGQAVPDDVVRRDRLAFCALVHEGEEPVPLDRLLKWVRETTMSSEPVPQPGATPPEFPTAIVQHLERWRTETVRITNEMRTGNEAFQSLRPVFEAWDRVAHFTGREADRDGIAATREESRAYYVGLLMELGQQLQSAGLAARVQALDAGEDAPRLIAVELLRRALAGEHSAVAHLDGAMRDASFVGGAAAAACLKNQLRYEVLGVRPPVPVPPNWEGPPPDNEIRTAADFVAWADRNLEFLHLFSRTRIEQNNGAEVRNAHRLLAQLGITHSYPFPHGGLTNGEEEAHLRNLRNVCLVAENAKVATRLPGEPEPQLPTKPADGPVEPFRFRWSGVESEFLKDERRYHRLLVAVWPTFRFRTSTHIKDANKKLEDLGGSTLELKTMQNYARELSKILTERFRFPARLELDGDYLMWRDLPETTASS